MVKIKQASISGRIGSGIGKGLAEQLPKEIERGRLASGLQQFEKESANLNPMQQLARLSAIPGITPQMVQSFGELGKQQAKGQALGQNIPSPFPQIQAKAQGESSQIPSITKEKPLEQIQEGFIPPTQEQIYEDAGRMYNENPALFNNDPQKAIDASESAALRKEKINEAYQKQHENLTRIQDNVVQRLQTQSKALKADQLVPANVYSSIEDKAIQATKPKKEGGKGYTEQQAIKEYGKELDTIARDYQAIDTVGNWGITGRKAKDSLNSLSSLQKKFEQRNDTENFADSLISKNSLSPMVAYSIAEPISRVPELNKELKSLPNIIDSKQFKNKEEIKGVPRSVYLRNESTRVSEKLAKNLGSKGSPLAVAYELQKKGYDPSIWLDYLNKHRDELNLTEQQGRQIDKPRNLIPTLNDFWLSEWTGLD